MRVPLDKRKACRRLVEVVGVRLDNSNAYRRLVEVPRTRFDYRRSCWRLVDIQESVLTKASWRPAEVWTVRFDYHKA